MSTADDLARASRRLYALGWMRGTSGNVSVRDGSAVLVTASGIDKSSVEAADAVHIDASGAALPGQARQPSAEAPVHAAVIADAGADAVVHVHSLAAVEAAARWPEGVPLMDVEQLKGIGRGAHGDSVVVPVVANSQDMADLSRRILEARDPEVPGVIVAEHGLYAWGASLGEAIDRTESFDWLFDHALRLDRLRRTGG
jgi:methylthioribulose-1-phosphate dehydratase